MWLLNEALECDCNSISGFFNNTPYLPYDCLPDIFFGWVMQAQDCYVRLDDQLEELKVLSLLEN